MQELLPDYLRAIHDMHGSMAHRGERRCDRGPVEVREGCERKVHCKVRHEHLFQENLFVRNRSGELTI